MGKMKGFQDITQAPPLHHCAVEGDEAETDGQKDSLVLNHVWEYKHITICCNRFIMPLGNCQTCLQTSRTRVCQIDLTGPQAHSLPMKHQKISTLEKLWKSRYRKETPESAFEMSTEHPTAQISWKWLRFLICFRWSRRTSVLLLQEATKNNQHTRPLLYYLLACSFAGLYIWNEHFQLVWR